LFLQTRVVYEVYQIPNNSFKTLDKYEGGKVVQKRNLEARVGYDFYQIPIIISAKINIDISF
jgi:gamma-glutamylcyclotransferase (GGCT)/AIG2-like uncharacterized protein YtfP